MLVAQAANLGQELGGHHVDTALALDRLDDHAARGVAHHLPQASDVADGDVVDAGEQRRKRFLSRTPRTAPVQGARGHA